MIQISKLTLLKDNPRTISKDAMEKLCKSIQEDPDFLMARPVLVNKTCTWDDLVASQKDLKRHDTYTVYAGNQRVRAAKKLKMKEIPCIIENDLCEEVVKKRTLLDNKTFGEFDFDILANEWDIDMLLDCGFTADDIVGSVQDINTDKDDKKKKCKVCPKCGESL